MYTPEKFRVDDIGELHEFMRAYSFATLITVHAARPVVSHIPLHLEKAGGEIWHAEGAFCQGQSALAAYG